MDREQLISAIQKLLIEADRRDDPILVNFVDHEVYGDKVDTVVVVDAINNGVKVE